MKCCQRPECSREADKGKRFCRNHEHVANLFRKKLKRPPPVERDGDGLCSSCNDRRGWLHGLCKQCLGAA